MDKKKLRRLIVIFPAVGVMVVVGALIAMVLTAGGSGPGAHETSLAESVIAAEPATGEVSPDMPVSSEAMPPVMDGGGAPGFSPGYPGIGAMPQSADAQEVPGSEGMIYSEDGYEGSGEPGIAPAPVPAEEVPSCEFSHWVGAPVDEAAVQAEGRPYRILPPGAMATMDYSPSRINLNTDDAGIVQSVTCG